MATRKAARKRSPKKWHPPPAVEYACMTCSRSGKDVFHTERQWPAGHSMTGLWREVRK